MCENYGIIKNTNKDTSKFSDVCNNKNVNSSIK